MIVVRLSFLLLAIALPAVPAFAGNVPSGPQVGIDITDGRVTPAVGDQVHYTVTVHNLGTVDIGGLSVTQTVPTGMKLDTETPAGTVQPNDVEWPLTLKAMGNAVFHATMTMTKLPTGQSRVASVACASQTNSKLPLVCATQSDALAGAVRTRAAAPAGPLVHPLWWYVIAGVVALSTVVVVTVVRRRSKSQVSQRN
jgi:uncharacterized repeat protein (TIGR01451 family)